MRTKAPAEDREEVPGQVKMAVAAKVKLISTLDAVDSFSDIPSMAGKYDRIYLANVVNEFPPERIQNEKTKEKYIQVLQEERDEGMHFIDVIENSEIPHLFKNNCKAEINVMYISAKDFAESLDMTCDRRKCLSRYFDVPNNL